MNVPYVRAQQVDNIHLSPLTVSLLDYTIQNAPT